MRRLPVGLCLALALVSAAQQSPETPTGFDNQSNGVTDQATHQADQAKFDEIEAVKELPMNRWVQIATLGVVLLVMAATTAYGEDKPEAAAERASESWLAIVDAGKYAESWEQASQSLKSAVTQEKWVDALNQARQPLGKVTSRKPKGTEYLENPPNSPAGKYVIVQFDIDFENKKSAIETVSSTLESDGKWRVSGYLIQ